MTQGIASSNRLKKVQRGSTDDKNPENAAEDFTLGEDLTILRSIELGVPYYADIFQSNFHWCDVLDQGSVLIGLFALIV